MGDDALIPLRCSATAFALGVRSSRSSSAAAMFGGMLTAAAVPAGGRGSTPTEAVIQMLPMVLGLDDRVRSSRAGYLQDGALPGLSDVGATLLTLGMFTAALRARRHPAVAGDGRSWRSPASVSVRPDAAADVGIQNAMPPKDMGVSTAAATFLPSDRRAPSASRCSCRSCSRSSPRNISESAAVRRPIRPRYQAGGDRGWTEARTRPTPPWRRA